MLIIREANSNDIEGILHLWEEFTGNLQEMEPDFFQLKPNAREIYSRMLKKMLKNPECHIVVAEDGAELVGYHVVTVRYPGEVFFQEPYGHVSDLYLKPDYRGKDAGRRLLEAGISWLQEQGIKKIDVKTFVENLKGLKFWKKNGFKSFEIVFKSTLQKNLSE